MSETIKYYIEVKASERLPEIEDFYTIIRVNGVKSVAEFHLYEKNPGHMKINENTWTKDDSNGYEYEVNPGSWLEPIEITEDEISSIIWNCVGRQTSMSRHESDIAASAILSKLKGE